MQNQTQKNKEPETQEDNDFVLSSDLGRAFKEMMFIVDELIGALDAETSALKKTDTHKFMSLQDRKLSAARKYQVGMTQLMARKEELKIAEAPLKKALEVKQEEFTKSIKENLVALERMHNGTKRLGDRIMRGVRDTAEKERTVAYGSGGYLQKPDRSTMGVSEQA